MSPDPIRLAGAPTPLGFLRSETGGLDWKAGLDLGFQLTQDLVYVVDEVVYLV